MEPLIPLFPRPRAAQSLSTASNRLKLEVGKFLNSVRAA
jgi:hypothetical protein